MQQSVASLFELYLARSDLRPSSRRFKRKALDYFMQWFGDMAVGDVTSAMAEDYKTMLATAGRSKRTANGYLANFTPFWSWLRRHGRIPVSPFEGMARYKITEPEKQSFSPAELGRLLMVSDDFWRIRICLGLLGCRRGEMLNIQVGDVRLNAPEPHILLKPKKASADSWEWELKDHAIRWVGLPERMRFAAGDVEFRRLVRERMSLLRSDTAYLCVESKYCQRCFGKTEVYDPTRNFQRMFRGLQRNAQIQPMKRYHELRATFATAMIDKCGLVQAADSLGHASVQTTRGYNRRSRMILLSDINAMAQNCYKSNVP